MSEFFEYLNENIILSEKKIHKNEVHENLKHVKKSFLLFDHHEKIQVESLDDFLKKLNTHDQYVKCLSIFGNTGDGKSYCLNKTFFKGHNVFNTSPTQQSCTIGVHCAVDLKNKLIIFDTEGLLSIISDEDKRTRLLLKILAISDVVIYKTKAERLNKEVFKFLNDASTAYLKYFNNELKILSQKIASELSVLGPSLILFHETQYTEVLKSTDLKTIQMQINEIFTNLNYSCDAFKSIDYVGNKKVENDDYKKLKLTIKNLISNDSIRLPRKISVIYELLRSLNDKFNGSITSPVTLSRFPDEYFMCGQTCLACGKKCQTSLGHLKDGLSHNNSDRCSYNHQYENKIYTCFKCYENGYELIVTPTYITDKDNLFIGLMKYAISGFVLECPHHGIIYRSREYWYGNKEPEDIVRTEIKHVWNNDSIEIGSSYTFGRKMVDTFSSYSKLIKTPNSFALEWIADKVAPSYWTPNYQIKECMNCKTTLEEHKKHHCRGCGKGFCDKCTSKRKIISAWSNDKTVRVCDECFIQKNIIMPTNDVFSRKITESIQNSFSLIDEVTKYPLEIIKSTVKPPYWKPDNECLKCFVCFENFSQVLLLHHCRSCGNGVCEYCSSFLKHVPSRGLNYNVRVCQKCYND